MNETRPWERQPTDTNKSFAAFCIYRDMGAKRSLSAVLGKIGKKSGYNRVLEHWSSVHHWQARVVAYDDDQAFLRAARKLEARIEIENNVLSDYRMLREAIEKYIRDYTRSDFAGVKPDDIATLIGMMKQADDYARRAVGLPDRITENKNEHTGKDGGAIIIKTGMDIDDL